MKKAQALAALSALSHSDRLDLVRLLVPRGADGMAAGEIARALGLSASRLSFHLSQMEAAGLLSARPDGRRVIYAIDAQGLGRTIAFLLNDCCLDHPEVVACCRHGQQGGGTEGPPPRASGRRVAPQFSGAAAAGTVRTCPG